MEVISTGFEGLYLIKPRIFGDKRGWFMETYNQQRYEQIMGALTPFVQDNLSHSARGILRGLHFQKPPFAQSKLVSVVQGSVRDIVVDLRKNSPTYGKYYSVVLDSESKNQLLIPRGFAHGFLALEDDTIFMYKCDNGYSPEHEVTLQWNDRELNIDWEIDDPIISEKDQSGISFKNFESPFN